MHMISLLVLWSTLLFNPAFEPSPPPPPSTGPAHSFGATVEDIRVRHGWSQAEVVRRILKERPERTDFSDKQFSRIEKGQWAQLNRDLVDLLCAGFQCTEEELKRLLSAGYPLTVIGARGDSDAVSAFLLQVHSLVASDLEARKIVAAGVTRQADELLSPEQTWSVLSRVEYTLAAERASASAVFEETSSASLLRSIRNSKFMSRAAVVRVLSRKNDALSNRVSADWLIDIEQKGRKPSYDELLALCDVYDCDTAVRRALLRQGGVDALINRDGSVDVIGAYWREVASLITKYPDIEAQLTKDVNQRASAGLNDTELVQILDRVVQRLKEKLASGLASPASMSGISRASSAVAISELVPPEEYTPSFFQIAEDVQEIGDGRNYSEEPSTLPTVDDPALLAARLPQSASEARNLGAVPGLYGPGTWNRSWMLPFPFRLPLGGGLPLLP